MWKHRSPPRISLIVADRALSSVASSALKKSTWCIYHSPETKWRSKCSLPTLLILSPVFTWSPKRHFQTEQGNGSRILFDNFVSGRRRTCLNHCRQYPWGNHESRLVFIQPWCTVVLKMWLLHRVFCKYGEYTSSRNFAAVLYCLILVARSHLRT